MLNYARIRPVNKHISEVGVASVGALAAAGHFAALIEPILADLSYGAAVVVAAVTIWVKLRNKG